MALPGYGVYDPNLPPDIAADAQSIARKRAIAEALFQQGMQPLPAQRAPYHWTQGLASLAEAFAGRKGMERADTASGALGQRYQQGLADEVKRISAMRQGAPATTENIVDEQAAGGEGAPATINAPAAAADPRAAVRAAMYSQYAPVRDEGKLDYSHMKKADEPYTLKPGETRVTPGQPTFIAPPDDKHVIPANWAQALPPGAKREPNDPAGIFRMPGPDKQDDVYAVKYENGKAVGYQKLDNAPRDLSASQRPYFAPVSTAGGVYAFDARTGTMKLADTGGKGPVVRETADVPLKRDLAAAAAGGKVEGEAQATATVNMPQTISDAERSSVLIDKLLKHPGFSSSVGWTWTPGMRFVEGSKEAGFMALLDQVKSGAFLDAYQKLRGGGAITDIEGAKATQAITRISKAQSETEFKEAAQELKTILKTGIENAKKKAAGVGAASAAVRPSVAGQVFRFDAQGNPIP